MRFTTRLFFYWVSIFLFFYGGIIGVVYLLWGIVVNVFQAAIVFFIVGMIPPGLLTLYFSKRLDYMESDDRDPPSFRGHKKAVFSFKGRTGNPFDEVMQRIDRQWIISFSDRENHVLKFRTDARMASWGLGGYLKMEDDNRVTVIVYPIHPRSKREALMVNQTFRVMKTILDP
jgi:hypothetical protein